MILGRKSWEILESAYLEKEVGLKLETNHYTLFLVGTHSSFVGSAEHLE